VEQANARRGKSDKEYTQTLLETNKEEQLLMVERLKMQAKFFEVIGFHEIANKKLEEALKYEAAIIENYNNETAALQKKSADDAKKTQEAILKNRQDEPLLSNKQ
jgi:N-acetylglutamate synthase-like GNAT family acetyltransferase